MDIDLIDQRVTEIVQSLDVAEARLLLAELAADGVDVEGDDDAAWLMRQLLFVRLPQLDPEQVAGLLQHHVLEAFEVDDLDFPGRVQDTISIIFDTDKRADILHHFLTAVESSDELLGEKPLTIDGAEANPTVQNWIKDYNYWPTENKLRQSIDTVNYASKAPNPQKLSAEDRALLIKLLGWYDEIRNSLFTYEASEDIDLEQYPNFDPRLLTASVDEFASPEEARSVLEKAMAVKRSPLSGAVSARGASAEASFSPLATSVNSPRPNVQGVLSNAPIKKANAEAGGSPAVSQTVSRAALGATELQSVEVPSKPVAAMPAPLETAKPSVKMQPPVSSNGDKIKGGVPVKVPDNLPMVEPEDLPAVMSMQLPTTRSVKPSSAGKPKASTGLPPTLNMNQIQAEVARKKNVAQEDIDQRLASLKKRSVKKN